MNMQQKTIDFELFLFCFSSLFSFPLLMYFYGNLVYADIIEVDG